MFSMLMLLSSAEHSECKSECWVLSVSSEWNLSGGEIGDLCISLQQSEAKLLPIFGWLMLTGIHIVCCPSCSAVMLSFPSGSIWFLPVSNPKSYFVSPLLCLKLCVLFSVLYFSSSDSPKMNLPPPQSYFPVLNFLMPLNSWYQPSEDYLMC